MKLAFVINVFREDNFHSGGERVFYELVNRAVELGHEVDLFCAAYLSHQNILKSKLKNIFFVGKPKDFKSPDKIEKFYREADKLIKTNDYRHVISENISPQNDIGILQGHSWLHYSKFAGNCVSRACFLLAKRKFINAQRKWLSQGYNKIIVPSEKLKQELVSNFCINESVFHIIYPGVDYIESDTADKFHNSPFIFGVSAPSFTKKGGDVFIKALSLLKNEGYSFKAKIICPKANKNNFIKLNIKFLGLEKEVKFLPHQTDMNSFYSSVDAVVMPSQMETFGLVALEAMMDAKPVVVSSNCGIAEIISDGENGYVFEAGKNSVKNLAEKLKILLDFKENYPNLSKNAKNTAKKYNWAKFCDEFYAGLEL